MQKPGWVSVLEGQGECDPEERSLSGAVVSAFSALQHTLVREEASLQDIRYHSWVEVGQTGSDAEKTSHVKKHKDDKYFQHFLWYYMTDITEVVQEWAYLPNSLARMLGWHDRWHDCPN